MSSHLLRLPLVALAASLYLAGCGNMATRTGQDTPKAPSSREAAVVPPYTGGGYYKDDGPGENPPDNLDAIPDAEPRDEPPHPFANRVYTVKGKRYVPDVSGQPYKTSGLASWYGRKFHGRPTSSGEIYDMYAMTAAHKTLPIPSYARVTNVATGDSVVVRINDRGPFHPERVIDLSYTAAHKLRTLRDVSLVEVERLWPDAGSAPDSFAAAASDVDAPQPAALAQTAALQVTPLPDAQGMQVRNIQAVYLQVGAFSNPSTADALTGRLLQKLGRVVPGVLRLEDAGLIKVQVGPFTTEAAADAALDLVSAAVNVKPYKLVSRPEANRTATTLNAQAQPGTSNEPAQPAYWLQLAAFSRANAADDLVKRVQSNNPETSIETRLDKGLTKVQAGPYATATLADDAAIELTALLGQRPYRLLR